VLVDTASRALRGTGTRTGAGVSEAPVSAEPPT